MMFGHPIALTFKLQEKCCDYEDEILLHMLYKSKNPGNYTYTLKLNIFAPESHRKLKLGSIEMYGNTK